MRFDAGREKSGSPPASESSSEPTHELTIEAQVEMVRRIAFSMARHLPSHVDLDELVGLGNVGLVEARVRYDEGRGVPFAAFAAQRIRGAMLDGLRQVDPLTRDERARVRRTEEVAPVTLVDFKAAYDHPTTDVAADEVIADHQTLSLVRRALDSLPARERFVIGRYFMDEQPLKSVGEEIGVTESRVCQIVGEAVAHLKEVLAAEVEMPRSSEKKQRFASVTQPAPKAKKKEGSIEVKPRAVQATKRSAGQTRTTVSRHKGSSNVKVRHVKVALASPTLLEAAISRIHIKAACGVEAGSDTLNCAVPVYAAGSDSEAA